MNKEIHELLKIQNDNTTIFTNKELKMIDDYIKELQQENKQLEDNWNKLRETLKNEQLGSILYSDRTRFADIDEILLKMQELEKSDSNE